jgi:ABC-type branched-subunit amino acid transport system ATPase component
MELYNSLTVAENLVVGQEARLAGANPWRQLISTRPQRAAVGATVDEALVLCGIADIADRQVGALSTGQRRLVELGRAYASRARLLLLDEPSSGLDHAETQRFGEILLDIVQRLGVGILLVEHDMSLVMRVCEQLYVLDFGVVIFRGTPEQARRSAAVRAAYLGAEEQDVTTPVSGRTIDSLRR